MTELPTFDPAYSLTARLILLAIFGTSLIHKVRNPGAFTASVEAYELLPSGWSSPAAWLLIVAESVAVVLLVLGLRTGAGLALALLTAYTIAITYNLARGRSDIDCGCSGPAARQPLSALIVARNTVLMLIAVAAAWTPAAARPMGPLDLFTGMMAALAFTLCYAGFNALTATASAARA